MDILFKNITIVTMDDARPVIKNGFLGVKNGVISYIGAAEPQEGAKRVIEGNNRAIMPGLINAHSHVPMTLLRGYGDDMPLREWLYERIFPAEAKLDRRAIAAGAGLGLCEMLRTGTTSFTDMYYYITETARAVLDAGMKASLSNAVVALGDGYVFEKDRSYTDSVEMLDFHGADSGRVKLDMAIHGEYTSNPAVRSMVCDFAASHGLNMHIHLSETERETSECVQKNKRTPTEMFYDEGVFDIKTTAAHCVWCTDEDFALLAEKGVSAVYNPVSNLKLASGILRFPAAKAAGVNVALGTDGVSSNNSHDMFEEMKTGALVQKNAEHDPLAISAYDILKSATVCGALAQGREGECGMLAEGFDADIIMIALDSPNLVPVHDIFSSLVYSASGGDVCMTMVRGRVLYENGEFKTLDYERIKREVLDYALPLITK